jgi:hypothetical protein
MMTIQTIWRWRRATRRDLGTPRQAHRYERFCEQRERDCRLLLDALREVENVRRRPWL